MKHRLPWLWPTAMSIVLCALLIGLRMGASGAYFTDQVTVGGVSLQAGQWESATATATATSEDSLLEAGLQAAPAPASPTPSPSPVSGEEPPAEPTPTPSPTPAPSEEPPAEPSPTPGDAVPAPSEGEGGG